MKFPVKMFFTIPEAAKLYNCSVDDLYELALCGQVSVFAHAVTSIRYGLNGNEIVDAPIFLLSVGQLKMILDENGAKIDPDPDLNPWQGYEFGYSRQAHVAVTDLRIWSGKQSNIRNDKRDGILDEHSSNGEVKTVPQRMGAMGGARRGENLKKPFEKALKKAKKMWAENDPKNHRDMADWLRTGGKRGGQGEFPHLDRDPLMRHLKTMLREDLKMPHLIYDKKMKPNK